MFCMGHIVIVEEEEDIVHRISSTKILIITYKPSSLHYSIFTFSHDNKYHTITVFH